MNDMAPPAGGGVLPDSPLAAPAARNRLDYDGSGGDLSKIAITNALLTLATLGVYRFWGKTRVRRYLWGHVNFLGDRLEYTGTGKELFIGFLVAIVFLSPLIGASIWVQLAYPVDHEVRGTMESIQAIIILFLIYLALYRARRYRLTRTQWRGIRFGQDGSGSKYALLAFGWGILVILSLGMAYAVYRTRLQHYRTTHTWFGDRRFDFEGRAAALFGPWMLTWLFFMPTFGLIYIWYRVREFRYFAEQSRCGALRFKSELSTGSVFVVFIIYYVVAIVVFGLIFMGGTVAFPVLIAGGMMTGLEGEAAAQTRAAGIWMVAAVFAAFAVVAVVFGLLRLLLLVHPLFRIVCNSFSVIGEEDYAAIAQSQQSMPQRGEGLADTLDVSPF